MNAQTPPPTPGGQTARHRPPVWLSHWSLALLVVIQVMLVGLLHQLQSLQFGRFVLHAHMWLGLLIMALSGFGLCRIIVRRPSSTPSLLPLWQATAARIVHILLLSLLVIQAALGLLQASARGDQLRLFGGPDILASIKATTAQGLMFANVQHWATAIFVAILAMHVGAAAFNHLVRKQPVLGRMRPAPSPERLSNRVPLGVQLGLVFGAILAATVAMGLYDTHQYVETEALRTEFSATTLAGLDGLRQAQLDLRSIRTPVSDKASPHLIQSAALVRQQLNALDPLVGSSARVGLAAARKALAETSAHPAAAITQAEDALESAIESQSAASFQRSLAIQQIGARGHDLILLTLAPTVMLAAFLAFLLTRSILTALSQARAMIRSVAQADHSGYVQVDGHGEFAALMREIVDMRAAVMVREQASAARQLKQREALEALDRRQREAEAAVRIETAARLQAETVSQTKTEFLSNMSHEIRTPLNGVLGMAQAMAADPLSSRQRKRLEIMRASGEDLLTLLNDLLDISKIEAGKLELEVTEFSPVRTIRAACDTFQAAARLKGLEFVVKLDEGIGLCRGDPNRLRQVVANLVSNAIKFTERGRVEVNATRVNDDLHFAVSDTGMGIADVERMFEKFVQGDASTTRRFGGTGLGLAISRDLVRLMGGAISAESQCGKGTRFVFALPLPCTGTEAPQLTTASMAPAQTSPLRVLAAEDNAVNQLVLRTLLEQADVELTVVEDGALAVEAWARQAWDVILMDIQMPVMDGRDATAEIRRREHESGRARTPIIALTANVMAHQAGEYATCGMDAVVAKPLNIKDLFETIDQVLAASPQCAEAACQDGRQLTA